MTFPDTDAIATYGGAISDYRQVPDPTVERSAAQTNALAATVAARGAGYVCVAATHTVVACGEDPALRNQIVLLGAHLDSWHAATGATDNATGSAEMMEALRIINGGDADVMQLYPMRHKFAWEAYNVGNANHWLPTEISMQKDIEQWKSPTVLSEDERKALKTLLSRVVLANGPNILVVSLVLESCSWTI